MRYFLGVMALAGYLLILSTFVSERVDGGVAGGRAVDSQRVGRTIVTTYEGGQEIVYGAKTGFGTRIKIVAALAFAVGLILAVFLAVKRKASVGQLIGKAFGMAFVGVLIAFITGMPIAVLLKNANANTFWIVVSILCVGGVFFFCFVGKKIYNAETNTL